MKGFFLRLMRSKWDPSNEGLMLFSLLNDGKRLK
jgi:hypothetical protein